MNKVEEDEYLRKYKPEGEDTHYYECVSCGCGPDGSLVFSEFGLCLNCMSKYRKKIPRKMEAHLGRLLLYGKNKKHTPEDFKDRFHKITEERCSIEGKQISRHQIVYMEVRL
jgi:hypothetical protein